MKELLNIESTSKITVLRKSEHNELQVFGFGDKIEVAEWLRGFLENEEVDPELNDVPYIKEHNVQLEEILFKVLEEKNFVANLSPMEGDDDSVYSFIFSQHTH